MPRTASPRRRTAPALATYRGKRNFSKTPEPSGNSEPAARGAGRAFVVQKHAASRLHYDFRLELGGTLKSWAVPKGVPLKKGERRLAVAVEDHPLDYGGFEGVIPQGEYGGGTVMLWDRGTWEPVGRQPAKDLAAGKLHVILHGEKLRGEWALVRLQEEENWLLIRMGDDAAPISRARDDESVLSHRGMKEIATHGETYDPTPTNAPRAPRRPAASEPPPDFIAPMLAKLVARPPAGEWSWEVKFDGYRVLARKHGAEVRLLSRNGLDLTERFAPIAEAIASLDADSALFDGEVVGLDAEGRPSFDALGPADEAQLAYYLFDLPWLAGESLTDMSLEERRQKLQQILENTTPPLFYSASLQGEAGILLREAARLGLEGLIAKRSGSAYEAGGRSGAWVKLKCLAQQEFVIGGWTDPQGSRQHLGALVLGYHAKGALKFAGKVGSGFDTATAAALHRALAPLASDECPFADAPKSLRRAHWVRPELVCDVRFTAWTRDGHLRHPVYVRMRPEKKATTVHRETPTDTP